MQQRKTRNSRPWIYIWYREELLGCHEVRRAHKKRASGRGFQARQSHSLLGTRLNPLTWPSPQKAFNSFTFVCLILGLQVRQTLQSATKTGDIGHQRPFSQPEIRRSLKRRRPRHKRGAPKKCVWTFADDLYITADYALAAKCT